MEELRETPLALPRLVLVLTSKVAPFTRSRTNTSVKLLVSPATRSLALLSKSAKRPLVEIPTGKESPLPPPVPAKLRLTSVVVPFVRSRKKTFILGGNRSGMALLLLSRTRLFAVLANRTHLPSGLLIRSHETPLPPAGRPFEGAMND